jgi:histidyl-tRNA synthetase
MVGDQELERRTALLRDMRTKEQTPVEFDGLVESVVRVVNGEKQGSGFRGQEG